MSYVFNFLAGMSLLVLACSEAVGVPKQYVKGIRRVLLAISLHPFADEIKEGRP